MANFGLQHIFVKKTSKKIFTHTKQRCRQKINHSFEHFELVFSLCSHEFGLTVIMTSNLRKGKGAIPNFATEKEQKRNFLDFNDVTLVVVDIKSERFVKSTCLQQDLFDMTMVTIMFDTKTSESESFIERSIEGIINIMMEFHHF